MHSVNYFNTLGAKTMDINSCNCLSLPEALMSMGLFPSSPPPKDQQLHFLLAFLSSLRRLEITESPPGKGSPACTTASRRRTKRFCAQIFLKAIRLQ